MLGEAFCSRYGLNPLITRPKLPEGAWEEASPWRYERVLSWQQFDPL